MSEHTSLLEIHKLASKMSDSLHVNKNDIESSDLADDGHIRMNQLVMDIYNEFESILKNYGDKPLKNIVPLVAHLLENLNEVSIKKEKLTTDLNILTDHHTILLSQYETGKVDGKFMEQRIFSLEDELQETRKEFEILKSTNLCSKNLLELKLKNATDQIYRLEERESEVRRAYSSLRTRYGDLFRTHVEYLEKKRLTYDNDVSPSSSVRYEPNLEISLASELEACASFTIPAPSMAVSHKGDSPYNWGTKRQIIQSIFDTTPELLADNDDSSLLKISDEISEQVAASDIKSETGEADEFPTTLSTSKSGSTVDFNISKEVSKLVKENNELEQTKNALNIVIHDLLTNIEELQCEHNQLRETISQQQLSRSSTQIHVTSLEKEVSRLNKALSDALETQRNNAIEMKSPFSRRSNFTREEMAKVLMERNQLKEDLFDLRESMRWSEVLQSRTSRDGSNDSRAWQRTYPKNGFLEFFSRLFRMNERSSVSRGDLSDTAYRSENENLQEVETLFQNGLEPSVPFANIQFLDVNSELPITRRKYSSMATQASNGLSRKIRSTKSDDGIKPTFKEWIPIPVICQPCKTQPVVVRSNKGTVESAAACIDSYDSSKDCLEPSIPLPKPLYRRPIPEALSDRMQVYCATCTFANVGSLLPSGKVLAGRSTFFSPINGYSPYGQGSLSSEPSDATRLSNEVWICLMGIVNAAVDWTSVNPSMSATTWNEPRPAFSSQIVVVDANSPARYVDSFSLSRSVVTCLTAVPGVSSQDYDVLRLSDSIWQSIEFVTPTGVPIKSVDPIKLDSSSPRNASPVTDSIKETNSKDCNTLSSLRNCLGPIEMSLSECSASRSSAFQSFHQIAPGAQDHYRIERQKFEIHVCPSSSTNVSSEDDICVDIGDTATAQQTVWLGCQNGDIFLHSSLTTRRRCLQSIRLPSGITAICHLSGRVFLSLANGHIVVLRRNLSLLQHPASPHSLSLYLDSSASEEEKDRALGTPEAPLQLSVSQDAAITSTQLHDEDSHSLFENTSPSVQKVLTDIQPLSHDKELICADPEGCWNLSEACVITCGPPNNSVTALVIVPPCLTLWAAYGKEILVIDTTTFNKITSFEVQTSKSANVKCMSYINEGVWISLRREHVVRLYNVFSYSLIQEVDLKYIIIQSLGTAEASTTRHSSISATAIKSSVSHLWIGTNSGVVITAPFLKSNPSLPITSREAVKVNAPSPVRQAGDNKLASEFGAAIDLSKLVISAYGHTEAVNFLTLVSVPGPKYGNSASSFRPSNVADLEGHDKYLMLSGGVGFVDHRNAPTVGNCKPQSNVSGLQGHLLAWSLPPFFA